jgi:hypothetical protein
VKCARIRGSSRTDLVNLSVGAISDDFDELENASWLLEKRESVRVSASCDFTIFIFTKLDSKKIKKEVFFALRGEVRSEERKK